MKPIHSYLSRAARKGICSKCNVKLTAKNWHPHELKRGRNKCTDCYNQMASLRERLQRIRRKLAVIDTYGGKCNCCGETGYEFLTVDHVKNDGASHREEIAGDRRGKGGFNSWSILYKKPKSERFQLLCFNCNCAKGFYGSCPHKSRSEHFTTFYQKAMAGDFKHQLELDKVELMQYNLSFRAKPISGGSK